MNRVWRVIFAGIALFAALFVLRLLPEAQFTAFASNTAPKHVKPYALSTWSNISCRAKGRFQERGYCGSPVIDQIVADGKDAIPILISQITDSRIIAEPVYDFWPRIRAGSLPTSFSGIYSFDDTWQKSTMPSLFPAQPVRTRRGSAGVISGRHTA